MSSMLCQDLQSCFEPRFVEPQAIGLKMAPLTKPFFFELAIKPAATTTATTTATATATSSIINVVTASKNNEEVDSTTKQTKCGWSLIESLTNSSQTLKNDDQTPYVHPLLKRYSSKLSDKSLELCTESLGSETGSDTGEDSDFHYSSSSDSEGEKSATRATQKTRHGSGTFTNKSVYNSTSFPPPLSSISGSNSIQVKPHRENGRLVIRTVAARRPQTCFQAERRDGCLTLRFTKDFASTAVESRLEEAVGEQIQEQEIEKGVEKEEEGVVEAKNGQEKEEEMEIGNCFDFGEERDGNWCNVGGVMGTEKFHQRPRSCKESRQGKNGLLSWEPFWVAT